MKKSRYNILSNFGDKHLLYNTVTGATVLLNDEYYSQYVSNDKKADIANYFSNMEKGGFYVADEIDEFARLTNIMQDSMKSNRILSLTIAPTLSCNFRCPYCYETGRKYNTMTPSIVSDVIHFIHERIEATQLIDGKHHVSISWYGGEPLLQPKIIEQITRAIELHKNVDFHSSIVTNGYYLTSDMAKYLKELNVVAAQVTVDGPPDIHNERRCLPNHSDTFYRILSNISEACEFLNISIRINIDRKNMERVDELLDYFDQYNLRGKVNVYIAAVDDINNIGNCYHSGCLNSRDFSEYESAFYMRNLNRGYTFVGLPRFNGQLCGAVASNSFVIDPLGDLYKCWDEIGIKEKSSGNVKTGFDTPNMKKWTCYNFTYYSECKECAFLPVCLGGCPYHNISSNIMNCATVRYNYVSLAQILNSRRTEAQNVYND